MLNIYLNTWGNYNENGADGGEWITLPMEESELIAEMERISNAMADYDPEYFINDYEWIIDIDYSVNENDDIIELNELLNDINDLYDYELETLEAIVQTGYYITLKEAYENIDNCTFYKDMSLWDVAYELANECYFAKGTPNVIIRYFDYELFARDLSFEGYYELNSGVVHIG